MITLVCNAAEASLDIVLGKDGDILCAQSWHAPTRGTEILVPALRDMLPRLGLAPGDIGRMACVRGPGSFTGVRLALTTAAALRRAHGISLAGLDFMQALAVRACAVAPQQESRRIWALTHARRDLVHFQEFVSDLAASEASGAAHALPRPVAPVELLPPAEAARRMGNAPGWMLGSGVARNAAALAGVGAQALAATQPLPEDLWTLARHAAYAHADIEPLYIRPCDAVDVLSPDAHARLDALLQTPATA